MSASIHPGEACLCTTLTAEFKCFMTVMIISNTMCSVTLATICFQCLLQPVSLSSLGKLARFFIKLRNVIQSDITQVSKQQLAILKGLVCVLDS